MAVTCIWSVRETVRSPLKTTLGFLKKKQNPRPSFKKMFRSELTKWLYWSCFTLSYTSFIDGQQREHMACPIHVAAWRPLLFLVVVASLLRFRVCLARVGRQKTKAKGGCCDYLEHIYTLHCWARIGITEGQKMPLVPLTYYEWSHMSQEDFAASNINLGSGMYGSARSLGTDSIYNVWFSAGFWGSLRYWTSQDPWSVGCWCLIVYTWRRLLVDPHTVK